MQLMDGTAEMIFTGDELLRGDVVNTNQAYLGERLLDLGILATRALCIADSQADITSAIRDSLDRHPVILVISGGLGPTDDDLTRESVAEALGRPLEHHEELLVRIRQRFATRGLVMSDSNRKQASLPRGASPIPIAGTAPGFTLQHDDTLVVALPGVPWELKEMWTATVEPLLKTCLAARSKAGHVVRRIRTFGIGESAAAEMLSEFEWRGSLVEIGTRANLDGLSIVLRATDTPEGLTQLETLQDRICQILGDRVFGVDCPGLPEIAGSLLRRLGMSVSTAESCTGGLLAARLTDVAGSSDYFFGGVTAYSNEVKIRVLGVPARLLDEHGAVSAEVAASMAERVSALLGTHCGLSTTGVAGPGGGSKDKPVGLVYVGTTVRGVTQVERLRLFGRRDQIRERAALSVLDLLRRRLVAETAG